VTTRDLPPAGHYQRTEPGEAVATGDDRGLLGDGRRGEVARGLVPIRPTRGDDDPAESDRFALGQSYTVDAYPIVRAAVRRIGRTLG
jgi:hypothetical protein